MLAAEATGDAVMTDDLQGVGTRIRAGQSLTQAVGASKSLTRQAKDTLCLAERAGSYDRSLQALLGEAREARRNTARVSGVLGYVSAVVASAVLVIIVLYGAYMTYFSTVLHVWDE